MRDHVGEEAVPIHRLLEVIFLRIGEVGGCVQAGPLVPAVHLGAGQAAERGELVLCPCGQEAR